MNRSINERVWDALFPISIGDKVEFILTGDPPMRKIGEIHDFDGYNFAHVRMVIIYTEDGIYHLEVTAVKRVY